MGGADEMSRKHDEWGWMLAADFFFAGLGGAMLAIAGIADLFLGDAQTSVLGNFAGAIFIAIGAGLLILELGRPFQAFRVFMNPKSILTFGAWNMTFAIIAGLLFASFGITILPWSGFILVRKFLAAFCVIFGLVVATYPGVLLARHKARPFWNGPGIMVLFFLSSFITGMAGHILSGYVIGESSWFIAEGYIVSSFSSLVLQDLPHLTAIMLLFQLIFWAGYIWIKRSGGTEREAEAAQRWVNGDLSASFQLGFILLGTIVPIVLLLFTTPAIHSVGACLAILGGAIMRYLVVRAGEDRTWLPGEQKYRSRLPVGDEEFLKVWK
ncbi:MAG: polysulfide reductase NrfD [Peptococcaceae bacterium]|nr:polysulfide reductase NrfD [Peptococcaceae bacterium]